MAERKLTEQALREKELFLENLTDIAYTADTAGNIVYVNAAVMAITGFTPEQIQGKPFLPLFVEEDHPSLMEVYTRTLGGESLSNVLTFVNGRTCSFSSLPLRDGEGEVVGTFGIARDITEQKALEERAARQQQLLETLLNEAPIGLAINRVGSGEVSYVNRAFLEAYKVPREKCADVGTFFEHVYGSRPELSRRLLDDVLSEDPERMKWDNVPIIDGEGRTTFISAMNILLKEQDLMVSTVWDTTEARQAREALRESEELYRKAIRTAGATAYYRDFSTNTYRFVDDGIEDLTGYSRKDFTPAVWRSIALKHARVGPMSELTMAEASLVSRKAGETWHSDVLIRARGGQQRWIADSSVSVGDESGKVTGTLGLLLDLTDRKQREEELRRTNNLESLGTLAGGIAHDFNNVLTGVMGNLTLLERMLARESVEQEIAAEARASAERTRGLTQQLMAFAKGGAPVKESVSIEEVLVEAAHLSLSGSGARPEYRFTDPLPPVEIDRGQIGQVVQNLVMNADQAMPSGGTLVIAAESVEQAEGGALPLGTGRYVKVTVQDQGIGMSEKVLARIFDPYYTTKEFGHGLGLSIAHTIISNHGGHIGASSEPEVGTTFEFYLPVSEKPVAGDVKEKAGPAGGSGRILVMDDEETVRRTTGRMLTMLSYEVAFAADGRQALQTYGAAQEAGSPYDLVIMDLTIPGGMGGKEAVVKLHEIDPHARVIVASGYANDPVMADPQAYGFVGGIRKPVDMDELAEVVSKAMEG
jgi:PAS domain S-box-containing protein